eukprot:2996154-Rhodomonas_salina.2
MSLYPAFCSPCIVGGDKGSWSNRFTNLTTSPPGSALPFNSSASGFVPGGGACCCTRASRSLMSSLSCSCLLFPPRESRPPPLPPGRLGRPMLVEKFGAHVQFVLQ